MQKRTPTPALELDISRLEKEIEMYSQEKYCYEAQILRVFHLSLSLSPSARACKHSCSHTCSTNDFDILLLEVRLNHILVEHGDQWFEYIVVEGDILVS